MPALVCHWLLGKRLEERARKFAGGEKFNEKCFYIGCQGPDIFFFSRRVSFSRRNLQRFGHKIHIDSPSQLFASIKKTLDECGGLYDDVLSYALGMCTHYAYDTCAHPYICQLEKYMQENDERGESFEYHAAIESALDTIMLRYETAGIISDLRLRSCIRSDKQTERVVALIYKNMLRDMYDVQEEKLCSLLVRDMRNMFLMLDDPIGIWKPMVEKIERFIGRNEGPMSAYMRSMMEDSEYDYANINHEPWQNIMNEEEGSEEDFFEITDRAEKRAEECMTFFVETKGEMLDFVQFTGEKSFSNNVNEVDFARK